MTYWKNKVVVITGGSEGLGRELGIEFVRLAAIVVILARDAGRLNLAVDQITKLAMPGRVFGLVTDVTDDTSVQQAIDQIIAEHRQIDGWINNVGKSTRVSLINCRVEQYRELMEINFYSAVRCSLAVLPHLEKTAGHLINIGSLASKTGWPFVAPYATSKHALSAFHHQLRLEGPRRIHYLHVCPGPIQRSDSMVRYADEAAGLGTTAAQPGAGVRLKGIAPRRLAAKIERACRQRKPDLVIPGYVRILFMLAQICPAWTDRLLMRTNKSR